MKISVLSLLLAATTAYAKTDYTTNVSINAYPPTF